ncbi:MobB family relaxase [Ekhidna sp.]
MPHVNFSRSAKGGGNKGSSGRLVTYLEKENIDKPLLDRELFFSHDSDGVMPDQVKHEIDNNVKGLGKNDQKFYEFSVSFSQKEMAHLNEKGGDIKDYVRDVMDEYAKNFNREGIESGKDIKYFAKVERERRYPDKAYNEDLKVAYSHNFKLKDELRTARVNVDEKAIKRIENGFVRNSEGTVVLPGNLKDGDNTHVHIIVSHKDANMSKKLSPLANHREGKITGINAKGKVGFNRDNFVDKVETRFDQKFGYSRDLNEMYRFKLDKTLSQAQGKMSEIMRHAKDPEKLPEAMAQKVLDTVIKTVKDKSKQQLLKAWNPKLKANDIKKLEAAALRLSGAGKGVQKKVAEKMIKDLAKGLKTMKNLANVTPHGIVLNMASSIIQKSVSSAMKDKSQELAK